MGAETPRMPDVREPPLGPACGDLCWDPHWGKLDPEDAGLGPGGLVRPYEVAPSSMEGDLAQKGHMPRVHNATVGHASLPANQGSPHCWEVRSWGRVMQWGHKHALWPLVCIPHEGHLECSGTSPRPLRPGNAK